MTREEQIKLCQDRIKRIDELLEQINKMVTVQQPPETQQNKPKLRIVKD